VVCYWTRLTRGLSLSEYGCTTNGRDFKEIQALMSSDMTPVYSGGLMYEYALEDNGYGIAKIASVDAPSVQEGNDFPKFAKALAQYPAPNGDGGAAKTTPSSPCPTKDSSWLVDTTLLPAIPDGAKAFMSSGAGKGPGLKGDGSQNAGGTSTGDAPPGSGSSTGAPHKNAANVPNARPMEKAPLIVAGLVVVMTLTGTLLI